MKRLVWITVAVVIGLGMVLFMRPKAVEVTLIHPEVRTVREYIAEEAKTRLSREYTVDLPVSGTVERIEWEIGDLVQQGDVLARLNAFTLEQQIKGVEAQIAQSQARMLGVDVQKPKAEDLDSAAVRVDEAGDALQMSERNRRIAQTAEEKLRKDFDRAKNLLSEGVISESIFDEAEGRYKIAAQEWSRSQLAAEAARKNLSLAELAAKRVTGSIDDNEYLRAVFNAEVGYLESQRALLQEDLEKSVVRAPVSGPILEKYVDNRRVLLAGTPLLKMGDMATIEIECDVLSEEVVHVAAGMAVEISGKAIDEPPVLGTVKRVYPAAHKKISALGIEQQRVKTLIEFDNTALALRPGTRLDVRIITAASENALAVPERSTFREHNQWNVFIANHGNAQKQAVQLGLKNDDWAEVIEGLSADDTLIADPPNDLAEGVGVSGKK
jgi:HlyD family secretion protein